MICFDKDRFSLAFTTTNNNNKQKSLSTQKQEVENALSNLESENDFVSQMISNMKTMDIIIPELAKHGVKLKNQVSYDLYFVIIRCYLNL